MKQFGKSALGSAIRLDDPEIVKDKACHDERANWLAMRTGLPAIGSKLVNRNGIEWIVQNHATVPTADSLQRWRSGDIQPENDLYPVVAPQNFSPKLMEFFHAIDRCTTKAFAMLDTMPGRRKDGHVPGGNSIDTVSHPVTNLLFLDAARVHETVIAHEFGHAWIQYVDECEDLRTLEDSDPQRLRMVNLIQSFVLDLKVNDLIRRKGFDMRVIEGDQAASLDQLAAALQKGYRPGNPREQVFMSLLVADQMLQRDAGRQAELARFDSSLVSVHQLLAPVADLSEKMAETVRKHGYDSHSSIVSCINECLSVAFDHCAEKFNLDRELVLVNPEEPNIDKFPNWIPIVPPKLKCRVGKHMAKNDIPWEWAHSTDPTLTERTRVTFTSPQGVRSEVLVPHRIGPPTPYFGMDENMAEILELKRQNAARAARKPEVPFTKFGSVGQVMDDIRANLHPKPQPNPDPHPFWPKQPGRPYMAGLGQFLTAARLAEQMAGEQPYSYALNNPLTYVDPNGTQPAPKGNSSSSWVELCRRQLQPGDYGLSGVYYGTLGIPEHWWIQTSSNNPNCQSIGYGPGGTLHHSGNQGAGTSSQLHCQRLPASPAQVACLCAAVNPLSNGSLMYGSTWCDTKRGTCQNHDYNFITHDCQNFTENILSKCGISSPWLRQNNPLYWVPIPD